MASLLRRFGGRRNGNVVATSTGDEAEERAEVKDGNLRFVAATGANTHETSFQLATGAPVETSSPLGHSVGPVTIIFMNVGRMVGTGIFSTREWFVA